MKKRINKEKLKCFSASRHSYRSCKIYEGKHYEKRFDRRNRVDDFIWFSVRRLSASAFDKQPREF